MELKVSGHTINTFNDVNIRLVYDSIADTFTFKIYYLPDNSTHRMLFRPGAYHNCTISHKGVLLITGTILSPSSSAAGNPPKQPMAISGYSLPGVLQDCSVKVSDDATSLQFDGMKLEDIARKVTEYYGIKVVVDKELLADTAFNTPYPQVSANTSDGRRTTDKTVLQFLDELCTQKNVILSHTRGGALLLTKIKADKLLTTTTTLVRVNNIPVDNSLEGAPDSNTTQTTVTAKSRGILYDFAYETDVTKKKRWLDMNLSVNGQAMHRTIQVVGQYSEGSSGNPADATITNPYVPAGSKRFVRVMQTEGDSNDTQKTARAWLGAELKNIVLTIEVESWTLGGHMITPNQMITVTNPELSMYRRVRWFIREVNLIGDNIMQRAVLTCVLPECYNSDPVNNVFG